LGPIPNPQSPIPNPQSPLKFLLKKLNNNIYYSTFFDFKINVYIY